MPLLKKFPIDISIPDIEGPILDGQGNTIEDGQDNPLTNNAFYEIFPGAIATSPTRIYIPATSQEHELARMLVYDYGGNDLEIPGERKLDEEFKLTFTKGINYGGATWYNGEIWVVSDEDKENSFIGCVERYSPEGVKGSGIGLPWMWGYELFQALGITVEDNSFYILTKRTGWFDDVKLNNQYQIERYNGSGEFEEVFPLGPGNDNPVGLTDNEELLYVGDITDNKSYAYSNMILDSDEDFTFDNENINEHGIGYNGASFSVLRIIDSNSLNDPRIFIYGTGLVIPEDPILSDVYDSETLVYRRNKQFGNIGRYAETFKVFRPPDLNNAITRGQDKFINLILDGQGNTIEDGQGNTIIPGSLKIEIMLWSSHVEVGGENTDNQLFDRLNYVKFISRHTLPNLKTGDQIVSIPDPTKIPKPGEKDKRRKIEVRFEILGFKEAANGYTQTIFAQRIE